MPFYETWGGAVAGSFQNALDSVVASLPLILGALIVFLVGLFVAYTLGKLVESVVKALKVDQVLAKLEVEKMLERAGWRLNSGGFLGALVRWFLIIVFLLAAVNVLGEKFQPISNFLRDVLLYIPNIVVAAVILITAAVVAQTVERLVRGSAEAMGHRGSLAGAMARWAIWIFAVLAALSQLKIAGEIVGTLVQGMVYGLALAFALAFGLGGRDAAADFIQRVRGELKK